MILLAAGDKKIQVIKVVRELTSLGLKEAKDLVDGAPKPVLEKASKEDAEKAKAKLEGVRRPSGDEVTARPGAWRGRLARDELFGRWLIPGGAVVSCADIERADGPLRGSRPVG